MELAGVRFNPWPGPYEIAEPAFPAGPWKRPRPGADKGDNNEVEQGRWSPYRPIMLCDYRHPSIAVILGYMYHGTQDEFYYLDLYSFIYGRSFADILFAG